MKVGNYSQQFLSGSLDQSIALVSEQKQSSKPLTTLQGDDKFCVIDEKRLNTLAERLYKTFSDYSGSKSGLIDKFLSVLSRECDRVSRENEKQLPEGPNYYPRWCETDIWGERVCHGGLDV